MKRTHKFLSLFLTVCMMLSAMPLATNAGEADEFDESGSEVEEDAIEKNNNVNENENENEVSNQIEINEINFPDEIFRAYVKTNFDTDENNFLSSYEVESVTTIDVNGTKDENKGITSLKGIEFFSNLRYIYCKYNQLTELDVSNNTALEWLQCYSNNLTALDVSKNSALKYLYCCANQLIELDVSNNTALEWLQCYSNNLTALDVSKNVKLEGLECQSNQLTKLDISKNTALDVLDCSSNQLTELDLENNTALTTLFCYSNNLTALDVSKNTNLTWFDCNSNQLTELDISNNAKLMQLNCHSNQLVSITSGNNKLENLYSYDLSNQSITIPHTAFSYENEQYSYKTYSFEEIPATFEAEFELFYDNSKTAKMTITYTVLFDKGDFNGSGSVDPIDLTRVRNYLANYNYAESTCDVNVCAGSDMNGDGKITLKDLIELRSELADKAE